MDYQELLQKKALYDQGKDTLQEVTAKSYAQVFELEYTYNSTVLEAFAYDEIKKRAKNKL